jgi:hypothetical protein
VVKKLCALCGLKIQNRREHREDTENTEKKLCVLRGIEFKTACRGRSLCALCG